MRFTTLVLTGILAVCDGSAAQEEVDPKVLDELDRLANGLEEAETGWLLYEQVLNDFQEPPRGTYYACKNVPGSPGWKHLATWLDENRNALPMLVKASHRSRYGMSYHPRTDSRQQIAIVSLHHNRLLLNLLCAAAREAEAHGLLDQAIEYVRSAYRIGKQISDRPMMIDQTIGLALVGIPARELRRLLVAQADALSTDQIDAISADPLLTFLPRPAEEVLRVEQSLFPEHYQVAETMNHYDSWSRAQQEGITFQIDATRAVLEIIRYRHVNKRYPESLDVFDTGVLSDSDRYRYSPPKGTRGFILYSVGEDGEDHLFPPNWDDLAAGKTRGRGYTRVIIPVR